MRTVNRFFRRKLIQYADVSPCMKQCLTSYPSKTNKPSAWQPLHAPTPHPTGSDACMWGIRGGVVAFSLVFWSLNICTAIIPTGYLEEVNQKTVDNEGSVLTAPERGCVLIGYRIGKSQISIGVSLLGNSHSLLRFGSHNPSCIRSLQRQQYIVGAKSSRHHG